MDIGHDLKLFSTYSQVTLHSAQVTLHSVPLT